MKHQLFIIYMLNTIVICNAMEKAHKHTITKLTTPVEKPCFGQYITDDRAIIAGKDKCCIINPITNKVIKEVKTIDPERGHYSDTHYYHSIHCAIHPNKKQFALSYKNTKDKDCYELE